MNTPNNVNEEKASNAGLNRRKFIKSTALAGAAVVAAPTILTAKKTDSPLVVGSGEHQYEVIHNWPQLPEKFTWQTTHNVAVDRDDFLYVIHEGRDNQTDHPAIFVFDPEGKYVRSFASDCQGGGHGLEIHEENGEQFIYATAYKHLKFFSKMDLKGNIIWKKHAPMDSGVYAKGEDTNPENKWGRDRFLPTNFAFLDDGGFLLADGYGAFYIHRYDKDANWVSCFGGPGKEDGKFNTPHGLWIDGRGDGEPTICVTDRANGRLQWFTLEGKHLRTQDGFMLPANADTFGETLLIPDLKCRLTLLDKDNKVIDHLGEDPEWRKVVTGKGGTRSHPNAWKDGRFVHPHDACFDSKGNIFVAEWVSTGRISKLKKLS